jgi:NADH-quinone oxidoreductase subunit N
MNTFSYAELAHALQPEIILADGAVLVLATDLIFGRRRTLAARLTTSLVLGALTLLGALVASVMVGAVGGVYGNQFVLDELAVASRAGVLVLALITLGVAAGAKRPRHPAEYVALILFATTGFTLMAAASHLLVAFAALELASLSLYLLAGFDKERRESAEAALKYFLFGGLATAFLLFGFSLLYGLTGELELARIAAGLVQGELTPLHGLALVMVLVGFGFKAAAAPFHLWAPDAYEGAPTPSAALIATASKLAGFTLFLRLLWPGLRGLAGDPAQALGQGGGWVTLVAVLAGASLLLGNLAALAQTNLRRLLAYSAIAHTGVMLLGVAAADAVGFGGLFYYLFTYGVATAGAFGVIAVLEGQGGCEKITDLAGLCRRSPLLAGCLTVFVLSLAGIPPLAGFFGKFSVFVAAFQAGGLGSLLGQLSLLAIALSAIALYYYLAVLKQALVTAPGPGAATSVRVPPVAALTLLLVAAVIVLLGLCPALVLKQF